MWNMHEPNILSHTISVMCICSLIQQTRILSYDRFEIQSHFIVLHELKSYNNTKSIMRIWHLILDNADPIINHNLYTCSHILGVNLHFNTDHCFATLIFYHRTCLRQYPQLCVWYRGRKTDNKTRSWDPVTRYIFLLQVLQESSPGTMLW